MKVFVIHITSLYVCALTSVCLCACPLRIVHVKKHIITSYTSCVAFQFLFTINKIDGCDLNNIVCCERLPKNTKVTLY